VTVEMQPDLDHANSWIEAMPRAVSDFRTVE
jgi:hypothetical protein